MPTERHRSAKQTRKRRRANAATSIFTLLAFVACLAVGGGLVFLRFASPAGAALGACAPDLSGPECLALTAYLTFRAGDLARPASVGAAPVIFSVQPGESASAVAARLAEQGVIADADLLRYYMRYHALDLHIEAGDFSLHAGMTIPEIARALGDASAREASVTIPEGWRLEQIADYLENRTDLPFGRAEFLALTQQAGRVPGDYTFLGDIPPGASFEGFLFPDTYRLSKEATASELVSKMLVNFELKVTPDLRAQMARQGLTLYQTVILASIVEREAVVADEQPAIAGVYLNRFAIGMKLDADPTVQYALGYNAAQGNWWKRDLTLDDLAYDSPYNTYVYSTLPPGPIASPGLSAIQAVINPQASDYLYFRAACDGSGRHVFARTLEEQIANACQ